MLLILSFIQNTLRMCNIIKFLLDNFCHRRDAYCVMEKHKWQTRNGQLRNNYFDRIFEPITEDLIRKHLNGDITMSIFPTDILTQTVKFICWDIDEPGIDIFKRILNIANLTRDKIGQGKIVIEASGTPGRHHVWLLFNTPIDLKDARSFIKNMYLNKIDLFPNQNIVINDYYCELPIRLPLGYHRVVKRFSYFVDESMNHIDVNSIL